MVFVLVVAAPVSDNLPTEKAILRGQVALNAHKATHTIRIFLSQQQRTQPAHGVTDEVESSNSETVEDSLGSADEEGDGDTREIGTKGLATSGGIVSDDGPALTGRMQGEEVMGVLVGRTEAMRADDGGDMGKYSRGIGVGRWRDRLSTRIVLIYSIP